MARSIELEGWVVERSDLPGRYLGLDSYISLPIPPSMDIDNLNVMWHVSPVLFEDERFAEMMASEHGATTRRARMKIDYLEDGDM